MAQTRLDKPSHAPRAGERLTIRGTGRESLLSDFADMVRDGLSAESKSLSCAFLYDKAGSLLFEEICAQPEYYLTRTEEQLLRENAAEIALDLLPDASLVELGSGSALKTRILIEELLRANGSLRYVPIDISRTMLEQSSHRLLDEYADLEIVGLAAEYGDGLHELKLSLEGPRLVLFLGSNVGNFERDEARCFLTQVRSDLGPQDRLLIGVDLRKDAGALERAYDDAKGVTARFNLNLLERINRELGGRFDLSRFRHRATYDEERGRVEIYIDSLAKQRVRIEALDLEVDFEQDESVHTENSHKYSLREVEALARDSGFEVGRQWLDGRGYYSLNRFTPIEP
jgi:dimethylhistidine N-methyltransferase